MNPSLIQAIAYGAIPVLLAITLHEVAHGYAAKHYGDPTAAMMGRLSLNPLRHVQTAVTRRCVTDNSIIGPDLALTIDQALRAITVDAARQLGLGDAIGSLEKGKEADLTLLERDPYATDPEKIMSIKVSETWLAGEKKFG